MRTLYLLGIIYIALFMSSCSTTGCKPTKEIRTTNAQTSSINNPKDPVNVHLLTKEKPVHPYSVIGKATVSKYNTGGIKRQQAVIHDLMRQVAASLNGDAVMDLQSNDKEISATVIAYKQILV